MLYKCINPTGPGHTNAYIMCLTSSSEFKLNLTFPKYVSTEDDVRRVIREELIKYKLIDG